MRHDGICIRENIRIVPEHVCLLLFWRLFGDSGRSRLLFEHGLLRAVGAVVGGLNDLIILDAHFCSRGHIFCVVVSGKTVSGFVSSRF